jgi:hypothetical protein
MNKSEILKLALDKATSPQEAMALARDMAAFLGDEPAPAPALPLLPAPAPAPAPLVRRRRPYTFKPAPNGRTSWTEADVTELMDLYTSGKKMDAIAEIIGRSPKAVRNAISVIRNNKPFGPTRRKHKWTI